jgi:hypothetical protein
VFALQRKCCKRAKLRSSCSILTSPIPLPSSPLENITLSASFNGKCEKGLTAFMCEVNSHLFLRTLRRIRITTIKDSLCALLRSLLGPCCNVCTVASFCLQRPIFPTKGGGLAHARQRQHTNPFHLGRQGHAIPIRTLRSSFSIAQFLGN